MGYRQPVDTALEPKQRYSVRCNDNSELADAATHVGQTEPAGAAQQRLCIPCFQGTPTGSKKPRGSWK